ncbi:MAG: hypothetical protein JNK48_29270 [Bryobacterales bacterium]|nr:hypothetical protein [Bryobacterales bacterium]
MLVSLGSGSAMGNIIAGVILTYMRPFRVGDRVRTIKNVEVIVPNSSILGAHISNFSAEARTGRGVAPSRFRNSCAAGRPGALCGRVPQSIESGPDYSCDHHHRLRHALAQGA